jgi:S-adenosylmethionine-diacylglycerol 3-amino-3-carboxypropyl transferase
MFDKIGQTLFRWVHEHNLVYASCWEDPKADRIGLQIAPTDRILTITSAGCNALDYLLESPKSIVAVDINYRQNALLELKRAAIQSLDWEDFFALFGNGHHPNANGLYRKFLRSQLTPIDQSYWDRKIALFAGRKSFYFRTTSGYFASWFRFYIDHVLRVRGPIERLLNANSIDEQVSVYESELRDRFWGPWLGFALRTDALLALSGIPPQQRRQVQLCEPNIQAYMQRQAERVIYHLPIRDNYFWQVYLTGEFTPEICPRYLKQDYFLELRDKLQRLTTFTGSVQQYLESRPRDSERFTRFVLLDHMDWLGGAKTKALEAEWQAILAHASVDCRILWRSLGLMSDFIEDLQLTQNGKVVRLGDLLEYDEPLQDVIRRSERVTAYGCVRLACLRQDHSSHEKGKAD